ncbi:MAG: MFS transporter [Chloroflexota bacterium]|nr:MFS transporter [Chloroflexota bacterium]
MSANNDVMSNGLERLRNKEKYWKDSYKWLEAIFYFFQGLAMSGIMIYANISMTQRWNVPITEITRTTALMGIPMYLKMLSGLLSDRVPIGRWGRRRPYILIGGLLYIPAYALLIFIDDFTPAWVAALSLSMAAWVFVDGTLDALTVDITPDEKSNEMQGAAVAGRFLGMAGGTFVASFLGPQIGWRPVLMFVAFSGVLQAITALLFKEPPITAADLKDELPLKEVFKETFGRRSSWFGILLATFAFGTLGFGTALLAYLTTPIGNGGLGLTPQEAGIVGIVNYIALSVGSFIFGKIAAKPKPEDKIKFYWISSGVSWLLMIPWIFINSETATLSLVFIGMILYGLMSSVVYVLTYGLAMQLCPESIEGFFFSTLTSFMNVGQVALGPNLVSASAELIGVGINITSFVCIILNVIYLLFATSIIRQSQENVS